MRHALDPVVVSHNLCKLGLSLFLALEKTRISQQIKTGVAFSLLTNLWGIKRVLVKLNGLRMGVSSKWTEWF